MGLFDWLKTGGKEIYNLSYHIIGETLGKKLADVGVTKTTERIFEDKRGELMADILSIAPGNDKLLERHKKASAKYMENRFVTLLIKIPRIEIEEVEVEGKGGKKEKKIVKKEVRKEMLKKLNALPDFEFEQYLEMLEHDLVKQALKRLVVSVAPIITPTKESAEKARDFLGQKMKERIEELKGGEE